MDHAAEGRARQQALLLVLAGLAVMYTPVFWSAATQLWTSDDQAHGPMILAVSAWWMWHRRAAFRDAVGKPGGRFAWFLIVAGVGAYSVGRAYGAWILQISSLVPVLAGAVAAVFGWRALREIRFALLFLVFAVPLPGLLVGELTGPLKREVSVVAESIFDLMGLPVARDGVILALGKYRLLIADACSGLSSMMSLFALAVVYVSTVREAGVPRNCAVLAFSIPVAFAANVSRVVLLGLITYAWGDDAGQGFLHGAAGVVMFAVSLSLIYGFDALLAGVERRGGLSSPSWRAQSVDAGRG